MTPPQKKKYFLVLTELKTLKQAWGQNSASGLVGFSFFYYRTFKEGIVFKTSGKM